MTRPSLREKKVGPFTVRERTARQGFQLVKDYPEASNERATAMLGQAVFNGGPDPIGAEALLDLGQGWFNELMDAYTEVNGKLDLGKEGAPTEGNA